MQTLLSRLKLNLAALFVVLGLVAAPLALPQVAYAAPKDDICTGAGLDANCSAPTDQPTVPEVIKGVTEILIFIVGAISVIMVVIGGLRYVLSGGDQAQTTSAKNTILYAIIGIIVAAIAYAIVAFVVGALPDGTPEP